MAEFAHELDELLDDQGFIKPCRIPLIRLESGFTDSITPTYPILAFPIRFLDSCFLKEPLFA